MAVVPVSGTNIKLLSGVPFVNDYKHSRWFDTKAAQTAYFQARTVIHSMQQANFQRDKDQTYIRVDASIDELRQVDYMMFQNASYNTKWFYAFVTRLQYVRKEVTYVHFQLDALQTWMFDFEIKPSFVVREHCPLWNSDGSPVINTIDEGLDYGTEYDNVGTYHYVPSGGYKWLVIVAKRPIHTTDNKPVPTIIGTPQPLSYYLVPFKDNNTVASVILPDESPGDPSRPTKVLEELYSNDETVNNIVSIYVTDYPGLATTFSAGEEGRADILTFTNYENNITIETIAGSYVEGDPQKTGVKVLYVASVRDFDLLHATIYQDKYSAFTKPTESKLLMYPYCQIVMDDFKGNRTIYKPEYINSQNLYINVKGSLGTSNKVSYNLPNYNHSNSDGQAEYTSNETALINNNPSDVPIITDYLAAYLQGNKNSIANQQASILWNGAFNAIGSIAGGAAGGLPGAAAGAMNTVSGAGNTVLQMQSIEAKKNDIENIPPQIAKMGSNTSYEYGNNYNGVFFIKKQIKPEYQKILGDFFNMYGYKVNRVKTPNLHTRQNWNYVQTLDCNVSGNFNSEDLGEIASIFDNGITLWHTNDVGNYALSNEVI